MNKLARRSILTTRSDPDPRLDYIVTLGGDIENMSPTGVEVRYVPDRLIIEPLSFGRYLETLGGLAWGSLEEIAVTVLDDVNNETVARWIQVTVSAHRPDASNVGTHNVIMEDRQPRWDNPRLLARLKQR